MIHLCTHFEVSNFSRYEDMKCVAKCTKLGDLGWFGVVKGHPRSLSVSPFDRAHTTASSSFIEIMRLSCTILDTMSHCRNSPHMHLAPNSNFTKIFGVRKLVSLQCAIVWRCLRCLSAVLAEHRLVTDTHRRRHLSLIHI